jgi:hypothetical protein
MLQPRVAVQMVVVLCASQVGLQTVVLCAKAVVREKVVVQGR